MNRRTPGGRRGHVIPFPQSHLPRRPTSEPSKNAAAEVVDLTWEQMLRAVREEMALGLVLQCNYDPWRVGRFIERRRARNARRDVRRRARLADKEKQE